MKFGALQLALTAAFSPQGSCKRSWAEPPVSWGKKTFLFWRPVHSGCVWRDGGRVGVALYGRQVGKVPAAFGGEDWVTGVVMLSISLNWWTWWHAGVEMASCQRSHAHNAYVHTLMQQSVAMYLYYYLQSSQSKCGQTVITSLTVWARKNMSTLVKIMSSWGHGRISAGD